MAELELLFHIGCVFQKDLKVIINVWVAYGRRQKDDVLHARKKQKIFHTLNRPQGKHTSLR